MNDKTVKAAKKAVVSAEELVTRDSDPQFYSALHILPNPDPILAKTGKDQLIYDSIMYDASVLGDLQTLRSGLLSFEWKLMPGADDPASQKAFETIKATLKARPSAGLRWDDFFWNIYKAVLQGQTVHELGWYYDKTQKLLLPAYIKDRPTRRFRYGIGNELRYLTRNNTIQGEEAPVDYRFLITKHMQSHDNPYGVAVLSACFWPWMFKHNGWKWFVKFAEKYGIPWAIGRYPQGTGKKEQNELAQSLAGMIEDAVAAIPEGTAVELLENKSSGSNSIQERVINLANREMTKAITGQSIAGEQQQNGSRAAAETGQRKTELISQANRRMVSDTVNQLLAWITELNFPGATAPTHHFYEEDTAPKEWVDTLEKAAKLAPVGQDFFYRMTKIEPPKDGETLLQASVSPNAAPVPGAGFSQIPATAEFSRADVDLQDDLDDSIPVDDLQAMAEVLLTPMLNAAYDLVQEGMDQEQILGELMTQYPEMDTDTFEEALAKAFFVSELAGRWEAQQDQPGQE